MRDLELAQVQINELIDEYVPLLDKSHNIFTQIASLDISALMALYRALDFEWRGVTPYSREKYFNDLYAFDFELNKIFSALLAFELDASSLIKKEGSLLFNRDQYLEDLCFEELERNGYAVAPYKLTPNMVNEIFESILEEKFENRGIYHQEFMGSEIVEKIANAKIKNLLGKNGDTLWIKDQNKLAHKKVFQEIAFDPFILSMVAKYLGCCPVHVQTNLWFSFPTIKDKNNLSSNGQMFHQDKEFLKFIKIFIYLTDVDENRGAHCYVEGSHIDEAYKYGVKISDRLSDVTLREIYDESRVAVLTGSAGTIAFGDTSCVHRGLPVKEGYRAILQIEYATSLYISPVEKYSRIENSCGNNYSNEIFRRLTNNYNEEDSSPNLKNGGPSSVISKYHPKVLLRLLKRYVL